MIGITDVASYLPPDMLSNLERAAGFDRTPEFVRDKIGFLRLRRKAREEETSDLCVRAFEALEAKRALDHRAIDCLVVCTQNPDAHGLPHTAAVLHAKLGLGQQVAAFDISLGCSGFVYSLGVTSAFMEASGLKNGLLFTSDPYSKILAPDDADTALLFGDAATVTYLTATPVYRALKSRYASDGRLAHSIQVAEAGGRLSMLGSNVFKFTMTAVPEQIEACLEDNGLSKHEIDLYLFHQGSKFIVDNLSRKLGLDPARAPFEAAETGNTVSSTLPLMLERRLHIGPRRILMSGFGVGLSWATTVLERV
ncbi:MAG TPA: ketoacyl-ACP synthase III [Gammaproteobacteria bacterium]|nr:ketoacyl-ACP synthase III [Gammaproteobacteria bacterium]